MTDNRKEYADIICGVVADSLTDDEIVWNIVCEHINYEFETKKGYGFNQYLVNELRDKIKIDVEVSIDWESVDPDPYPDPPRMIS